MDSAQRFAVGAGIAGAVVVTASAVYARSRQMPPVVSTSPPGSQPSTSGVIAASSGGRSLGPTLSLEPGFLSGLKELAMPVLYGSAANYSSSIIDTGTSVGLGVSAPMAQALGFKQIGSASVSGVGNTSNQAWEFEGGLTIGGVRYTVRGIADPNWHGRPLLGLPFMQSLYPDGWVTDLRTMQIRPISSSLRSTTGSPRAALSRPGLTGPRELIVNAAVGHVVTQAVMDTGNQVGAVISPLLARQAGIRAIGPAQQHGYPYAAPGELYFTAPISLGGVTRTIGGLIVPNWTYIPLLGIPFWQEFYPEGWATDLVRMEIRPPSAA